MRRIGAGTVEFGKVFCISVYDTESHGILTCGNCADSSHPHCVVPQTQTPWTNDSSPWTAGATSETWLCGNCSDSCTTTSYPGPTIGGINIGVPTWPQISEGHLCNHTAVDNLLYMFTDPWTGEKPWHRVKRNGKSYYSANTKHSLYAQWQMILERCNQPDRCYFKISIRVEPAWRGCYTLGSGHNSLTNMRSSRTCIMPLAVWDHGPALRRQRLALCPSIELLYGRYCPGNIRWAWISLQAANKWEQVRKKQNRSCT